MSAVLASGFCAAALAAEPPLAISPGGSNAVTTVEVRCPTFSWGVGSATDAWRLAVYRLAESSANDRPGTLALAERLPGVAFSWTPPLERCLARGATYAWSIGAEDDTGETNWSEPRMFRVAPREGDSDLAQTLPERLPVVGGQAETGTGGEVSREETSSSAVGSGSRRFSATSRQASEGGAGPTPASILATGTPLLDLASDDTPVLKFEQDNSTFLAQKWVVGGNEVEFQVANETGGGVPFTISSSAPSLAFVMHGLGVDLAGIVTAAAFSGDGSSVTGVNAAGLACSGCVGSSDIASNAVGSSEILNGAVRNEDIAADSLTAARLAASSVGWQELAAVVAVAVECDGECSDATVGNICDSISTPSARYQTLAVTCSDINDSIILGTNNCFGDNDCSGPLTVSSALPLSTFCNDTSGIDALVHCLLEGSP